MLLINILRASRRIRCLERFISSHLYQIFTYVKNSDKGSTGNVAGVLLYAKTEEDVTPNDDFNMSGKRISLKTLYLNQGWNIITEQLEALCGWLTESTVA